MTTTQQDGLPGSSGRTCSAEAALSSRTSRRRAGQQGPVQAALGLVVRGDLRRREPQAPQQRLKHLAGLEELPVTPQAGPNASSALRSGLT
ncbi:hypothetical protein [Streptomyces sp. NBC_00268]|uniref:hypothetical protein n=1 Tax=Streptomyces sp. NBC_00268 TaxID=2975695 RepID=UPI00225B92A7|nr:hypothetical protein [Streptomyces sp. NBC_00268]MCX5187404.1 hypothetical protein [Streptomyces sp. NBC_00268]